MARQTRPEGRMARSQSRKCIPLNNNRGNNRRRGRGNNRSQGGNQLNRIDSRARGNAPQLLEKYKKLAHDASLNGDRVQMEYYLQFADHYFRVIADSRTQKDEFRTRREERDFDSPELDGEEEERFVRERDDAEETPRVEDGEAVAQPQSQPQPQVDNPYEPVENPFTRGRGPRERSAGRPRADGLRPRRSRDSDAPRDDQLQLDPGMLPPAINTGRSDDPATAEESPIAADAPVEAKPRRRTRRTKAEIEQGSETLQQAD